MGDEEVLTKIYRITVGGQLGGIVRNSVDRWRQRKIKVVDADGNVVRLSDLAEVHQKLRERFGVEFDVQEGKRPTNAECPCGRLFRTRVLLNGQTLSVCPECQNQKVCAGWCGPCPTAAKPMLSALLPGAIRYRKGAPWRCPTCKYKMREARKRAARGDLCPNGHAMTGENVIERTSQRGTAYQRCRECQRVAEAKAALRNARDAVGRGLCRDCKKRKIDPASKSRCRRCLDAQRMRSKRHRATM